MSSVPRPTLPQPLPSVAKPEVQKAPSPAASFAPAKSTAQKIIEEWAAGLVAKSAPDPVFQGPLSWVRLTKVPELIKLLNAAGVK